MNIQLTLAWRYLKGRGLRTLLTTLAVVLAVMLMFGLNGVLPSVMGAFNRSLLRTAGKVDINVTNTLGDTFNSDIARRVARVPGIEVASPVLERTVTLPPRIGIPDAQQVALVTVVGVDPLTTTKVRDLSTSSGRFLAPSDSDSVVLASDLARQLGVRLGGELSVPSSVGSTRLRVVGLLGTPTVPGQEQIFVTLATAQRMLGEVDKISSVEAALTPGADRTAVQDALTRAVGSNYVVGGVSTLGPASRHDPDGERGDEHVRDLRSGHRRIHHPEHVPHRRGRTASRRGHAPRPRREARHRRRDVPGGSGDPRHHRNGPGPARRMGDGRRGPGRRQPSVRVGPAHPGGRSGLRAVELDHLDRARRGRDGPRRTDPGDVGRTGDPARGAAAPGIGDRVQAHRRQARVDRRGHHPRRGTRPREPPERSCRARGRALPGRPGTGRPAACRSALGGLQQPDRDRVRARRCPRALQHPAQPGA